MPSALFRHPKEDGAREEKPAAPRPADTEDKGAEREAAERAIISRIRDRIAEGQVDSDAEAQKIVTEETAELPRARRTVILQEVRSYLGGGLGPLQRFMDDPTVNEIRVNDHREVRVERAGRKESTSVNFRDEEELQGLVGRIVGQVGRRFDLSEPMVDARLQDGSRINAVGPPVAVSGIAVTIRKFPKAFSFGDLIASGTIPEPQEGGFDMAACLRWAVRNRLSIVVSGGTSSGKTTFINALTGLIPKEERLVIVEDASELQPQQPDVVRLEARPPSLEGKGEIKIRALVRNALRMSPTRIIVGECRDAAAWEMLQAMNTGHPGSMTTVHANSPKDAVLRLEGLSLQAERNLDLRTVRRNIASAVHLIVQVSKVGPQRLVTSLSKVAGYDDGAGEVLMEPLYERPREDGAVDSDIPAWARSFFKEGGAL